MNVDEVAAELYEARIAQGLSPRDLERMTGVSDDAIARFELGQVRAAQHHNTTFDARDADARYVTIMRGVPS